METIPIANIKEWMHGDIVYDNTAFIPDDGWYQLGQINITEQRDEKGK